MEALRGEAHGLRYGLRWLTPRAIGTSAEATQGELYIEIDGRPVWGEKTSRATLGLPWTWVEILEHLARQWSAIVWEETDPLGLNRPPWEIRRIAGARWKKDAIDHVEDREQRMVLRFERSHNLAFAVGGASLPALWLLREGADMVLAADRRVTRRPFAVVKATLEALGNEIAERLAAVEDERSAIARREWDDRGRAPLGTVLRLATHLSQQAIADIEAGRGASDVWGLIDADSMQPTAELAAARMFGAHAPPKVIAAVLGWIQSRPAVSTQDLDALSAQAEALSKATTRSETRAFAHGHRLAAWLRTIPGVVDKSDRVDPEHVLAELRVRVDELDLGWPDIEAIACWSAMHGPAILLNPGGRHAQGALGRRATLAHELCHMLIDRRRSLPLAEVLGGQAPVYPEQRANAFAAELLLPRETAGTALRGEPVAARVLALKNRYGVSSEIIAWQAVRSLVPLARATLKYLRSLVTDTVSFDRALVGRS